MKTRLIFVRHGELEGEQKGILHTPDDQVSLSQLGKEQMVKISEVLKNYECSLVVSSKEKRTKDSSKIISQILRIPTQEVSELEGRKWGDFSGKTWDEVGKILSGFSLNERYEFVPPNGESWKQFEERFLNAVTTIANQNINKTVVIASHGSTIRVLLPKVFDIGREESLKLYPDYGTLSISDFENGKFEPIVFNGSSNIPHSRP